MKRPLGLRTPTTTPGHYAALAALLFATSLAVGAHGWNLGLITGVTGFDAVCLEAWMLGVLAGAYLVWLCLVLTHRVTAATGGGLSVAAYAFALRALARVSDNLLPWWGRVGVPDEPVYGMLDAAYAFGLVAYVLGLAFVVAACVAEVWMRRGAPDWTVPE